MGYRIEVRDRDLNRIGIIDTWIQLDMVVQFCDQGAWKLLVKAGTPQAELLQQGGGVAIYQDGVSTPVLTGQIEDFQKYWTVEQHSGVGSVYVGGKSDNKLAYTRLAFPDPARTVANQYASAKDVRAVKKPANVLMWEEVNFSLGPGAISNRKVAGVTTGTVPSGVGGNKSDTLRYDVIGEKFSEWCSDNKTGWRFIYNPNTKTIDLRVYTPRDLSNSIRFSPELGNLREYVWMLSAPKVTRVIVACQGEGKERYVWQKIDSASEAEWGLQIESFVDRRDIPLKTSSNGSPALVTKPDSSGFEDIGFGPDGADWTTDLTAARLAYENSITAVDTAKAAVETQKTGPWQVAKDNLDAAQQAYDEAAPADKPAALAALNAAQDAFDQEQLDLDVLQDAQVAAEANVVTKSNALKAAITDAKATAVEYYLEVIEQAAKDVLKEGEKSGNFQIYPVDTEQIKFGRDYFVGDIVSVEIDGTTYKDIVREVSISVDDGGNAVTVSPKIGEQGSGDPLNLYQSVFDMRKKIRKLEARM